MRASTITTLITSLLVALLPATTFADRLLRSSSLNTCQENSNFSATLFDVVFTPNNGSLAFDVVGVSSIEGNVTIEMVVFAYGLDVYHTTIDPCASGLQGLCPMSQGQINLNSNADLPEAALDAIPGESLQKRRKRW